MKKHIIASALTFGLAMGLLSGCGKELPAVYVQSVATLTGYGSVGAFNTTAGVVVSQNEVKVERDESRKIAELKVEVGQEVTVGQPLFTYDTEEMKLTIDKAVLEIEQLKNSVTDFDTQIAQLEKEKKAAPSSEQLSYTVRIQSLQADKKEAQYNISVKERELQTLHASAENGEVTSPVDGKVQAINENGGYDDRTGQPLPYITLTQSGAYRIKGKVNELNRDEIYTGLQVVLRSRIDAEQTWTGVISEIDTENPENNNGSMTYYYGPMDDTTSSSNYPFYVELDSTEGLMLGQHVYIEPNGGQEQQTALMLDASFVQGTAEEGYWVWAADSDDKIERRSITVGTFDEMMNSYEITDGLTPADYIAFPEESVQEGAPVTHDMPQDDADLEPMYPEDGDFGDMPNGLEGEGNLDDVFDGIEGGNSPDNAMDGVEGDAIFNDALNDTPSDESALPTDGGLN